MVHFCLFIRIHHGDSRKRDWVLMACLVNEIHTAKMWQCECKIQLIWLFGLLDIDMGQALVIAFNSKVVLGHAKCLRVPASFVAPLLPCDLTPFATGD